MRKFDYNKFIIDNIFVKELDIHLRNFGITARNWKRQAERAMVSTKFIHQPK